MPGLAGHQAAQHPQHQPPLPRRVAGDGEQRGAQQLHHGAAHHRHAEAKVKGARAPRVGTLCVRP